MVFGDGFLGEMFSRGWHELIARDSGLLHVRLLLQPLVASVLAASAGWNDARAGRGVFFWGAFRESSGWRVLLAEVRKDVGKLFLFAALLDVAYQLLVLRWVYPVQTLIVASLLAVLPYFVVRGLANRVGGMLRAGGGRGANPHEPGGAPRSGEAGPGTHVPGP